MYYINNVDSEETTMTLLELKALWAQWIKVHGTPAKGSKEQHVGFAVRNISYYLEHDDSDLTLSKVVGVPGLGVKRIKYIEDVLGINFARKEKPVKPAKYEEAVYVLLEKFLDTEDVRVAGVYTSFDFAQEVMEGLMELFEEERSYKIEDKLIADKKAA